MARHADDDRPKRAGLGELALAFLRLGCLSFGGPIAHLGYLRAEFVERRAWLDDRGYAELVALCQFLPGPASSQVVFALGMHRAGLRGALLASLCFTLPSALLMIAFAYGVADVAGLGQAGWLHGLKLAAVGVVAQAVWAWAASCAPIAGGPRSRSPPPRSSCSRPAPGLSSP
jgi:chromate transporter